METEAGRSGDGETALAILSLVARDLTELFGSVDEVDWDRPTPCAEWTLRDLTDLTEHVTGGNRFPIRILAGDNSEEAMAVATRSLAADDTRTSLVTSMLEFEDSFLAAGVLDRRCDHVTGDLSGHEVLRLRLHDLIIHTWHAAQVLGGTLRPEPVRWALTDIADDTLAGRHFGVDLPTAGGGGSDQTTLLAAFGRRAH
jgi:uncharacterized protein (TIGR03086 family)